MKSRASADDLAFRDEFEALRFPPAQFKHREHLRLAYVYLCEHDVDGAHAEMRNAIQRFLAHHGVDPAKYHETITRAWVLAVRHFLARTPAGADSFAAFADRHPAMLNAKIMLTHYSPTLLAQPEARVAFAEPDLDPIPRYA